MIIGAQLFIRFDMPGLAAVCTFPRGTGRLLNGLGGNRGRGAKDAGVDDRWARGLCLLTGVAAFLVPLQSSKFFLDPVVCLALVVNLARRTNRAASCLSNSALPVGFASYTLVTRELAIKLSHP